MNKSFVTFLLLFAAVIALCVFGIEVWKAKAPAALVLSNPYYLLGFFVTVTFFIHLFLTDARKGDGKTFINKFLASTIIKLFLYLGVLVVLLIMDYPQPRALILHFLFFYMVFTVFEVWMLYGNSTKQAQ